MLIPGSYYNITVHAPAQLGSKYRNAKLTNILDYQMASMLEPVAQIAAQVQPDLPKGTISDYRKYIYYLFELPDGTKKVLADVWIVDGKADLITNQDYTLIIKNSTPDDIRKLTKQLNLTGYDFIIE